MTHTSKKSMLNLHVFISTIKKYAIVNQKFAPNCWFLSHSHTTTLHSTFMFIRTLHRSESFVGNYFWDLNNQLWHYSTAMSSLKIVDCPYKPTRNFLACFVIIHMLFGKLPRRLPIHNYTKSSIFNSEILK